MGEGKAQTFQDSWPQYFVGDVNDNGKDHWKKDIINDQDRDDSLSPSSATTPDDSTMSNGSSFSLDATTDDDDDVADSSPQHSCFSNSTESLYDFSELMDQLPIKRGLSKFYQGKSESFASLSKVTSLDDLKKKETPYRRNTKANKNYRPGWDKYKSFNLPKPIISKKTPRASLSSFFPSNRVSFVSGNTAPQIPSQKH